MSPSVGDSPNSECGMRFVRMYADSSGDSHFEDVTVEQMLGDYSRPTPPVSVSAFTAARQVAYVTTLPAGSLPAVPISLVLGVPTSSLILPAAFVTLAPAPKVLAGGASHRLPRRSIGANAANVCHAGRACRRCRPRPAARLL